MPHLEGRQTVLGPAHSTAFCNHKLGGWSVPVNFVPKTGTDSALGNETDMIHPAILISDLRDLGQQQI